MATNKVVQRMTSPSSLTAKQSTLKKAVTEVKSKTPVGGKKKKAVAPKATSKLGVYQSAPRNPKASSSTPNAKQMAEIKRKARLGIPLVKATDTKMNIYNGFRKLNASNAKKSYKPNARVDRNK